MADSLTSHKSAHCFFRGKKESRKFREKSGFKIPAIFDLILLNIHRKGLIFEEKQR